MTTESQNVIVGLSKENALDVFLKPMLSSYDPLRRDELRIFRKFYDVINEKKLVHMGKPKSVVQAGFNKAKATAGSISAYGAPTHESKFLRPQLYDIFVQRYPEDFRDVIDNLASGRGNQVHVAGATEAEQQVINATMQLIMETASDDVYRAIFFGDKSFTKPTGSSLDDEQVGAIKQTDGIWKDIKAGVAAGKVPRIDLGGTGGINGSAIPEDYALETLMPTLRNNASQELKQYKAGRPIEDRPVFLVDEVMFEAYKDDLKRKYSSTWTAFQLEMKGDSDMNAIRYGLEWDGYAVIPVHEWGAWNTLLGTPRQYRAIFTARENMSIGVDTAVIPGDFLSGGSSVNSLEVYPDANARDKSAGALNIRGTFKLDAKVANYELISVAY